MARPKKTHPVAAESIPPAEPEPARSDFINPADNQTLLGYYRDLGQWHGYIKFLEPGRLRDNPDTPIHKLYVEPFVTSDHVHTDTPPKQWLQQAEQVLDAVAKNRRLVLLGDPGSGKSTLVSWISWQLSFPGATPWQQTLGPLVPFPMVLRELKLDAKMAWEDLLEAFLEHPVAEKLRGEPQLVWDLLESGQALLMLDGLDEIGDPKVRGAVQGAAREGAIFHPRCRFLSTSRVVGYQSEPLQAAWEDPERSLQLALEGLKPSLVPQQTLRYLAPFADDQIERFARNWHASREAAEALAEEGATSLVRAIHGSQSTLRLARNPNLLTLMALIHRVRRRLPHGRIVLFEQIAEAYLEAIDAYRGIQESDFSLAEKKRWLAYIGFQMQVRRGEQEGERQWQGGEPIREVLIEQEQVREWLLEAMKTSPRGADPEAADRFLDYIGRRSGLLLPRGEGLFAFTHLSFQEYFAACHLEEQITSRRWARGQIGPNEHPNPEDLASYPNENAWRESLILLFELLAEKRPDWIPELLELLFGPQFELASIHSGDTKRSRALLLADVALDPYSGLTEKDRRSAGEACWLVTGSQITDLDVLSRLPNLRQLYLSGTQASDLTPLQNLQQLQHLDLSSTQVSDLTPLQNLQQLRSLDLDSTPASDLTPLQNLQQLRSLYLRSTQISDLTPLQNLQQLQTLSLTSTQVSDLTPLQNLQQLRSLDLRSTQISDLTPLQNLQQLQYLDLRSTQVSDLTPLQNLQQLQYLDLTSTQISDLTPLKGIEGLEIIRSLDTFSQLDA